MKVATQIADLQPVGAGNDRNIARLEREQHHSIVENLVVLQVVQKRVGDAAFGAGEKHGGPGNPHRWALGHAGDEEIDRHRFLHEALEQDRASALPRREQRERRDADRDRKPATLRNL